MKNLIIILSFVFGICTSAYSYNNIPNPSKAELVYTDASVSFSINTKSSLILETRYNQDTKFISIETENKINLLQVINKDGELEYQLPIGSNILNLSLLDFEVGNYEINLLIEGQDNFISTELNKII